MELKDDDPMPFGKHRGTAMKDVPASYLLWLGDEGLESDSRPEAKAVGEYIERCRDALEEE